jgi:hypothetical protein|tara:strand:+ start:4279 stop:4521 length:243 start_codon:yes stop_codon:yes gene_type:complete
LRAVFLAKRFYKIRILVTRGFNTILSAPLSNKIAASFLHLTPPPEEIGIKTFFAILLRIFEKDKISLLFLCPHPLKSDTA